MLLHYVVKVEKLKMHVNTTENACEHNFSF